MVTNPAEYAKLLWKIQDQNPPTTALLLPNSERLIEVDLNTRLISAPEYLSVATDHRAETVFFVMDRFLYCWLWHKIKEWFVCRSIH